MTALNHQVAEKFYQHHSDPDKAKQVYLNTLSVQAVHFYLTCLDIKTDLENSQSWNPLLQVLTNTADLRIEGFGSVECCLVLNDEKSCLIPSQASERIAYIAVRLNSDLTEAELLGFVFSVETETLFLEKLQSIDELPNYLYQLATTHPITRLSDWFHTVTESGWKTLEMLIGDWQESAALSFRSPVFNALELPITGVRRGKLLTLGDAPEEQVLLLIEVTPRTRSEYQINLELCPIGKERYLPRSLHVSVLDEVGKTVLQAESNESEGLEFQFSGERKERFGIRIRLLGCIILEAFEI
ncbi:DUF1822 family protein [Leptolyngbya sp. NIES-2104]|uniref:DUF1822 family protein n=1 Tax=Leptolyngbya sp. NIES-2104 TaxID=1552121 RepID=UPI0006EC7D06|nr:DUF1822 family protein [Leptolyngbya sp. NIES-2104]GAP94212.1 large extracellular alpha-helical protein [Leptolyngbya sp. NIES-2104]